MTENGTPSTCASLPEGPMQTDSSLGDHRHSARLSSTDSTVDDSADTRAKKLAKDLASKLSNSQKINADLTSKNAHLEEEMNRISKSLSEVQISLDRSSEECDHLRLKVAEEQARFQEANRNLDKFIPLSEHSRVIGESEQKHTAEINHLRSHCHEKIREISQSLSKQMTEISKGYEVKISDLEAELKDCDQNLRKVKRESEMRNRNYEEKMAQLISQNNETENLATTQVKFLSSQVAELENIRVNLSNQNEELRHQLTQLTYVHENLKKQSAYDLSVCQKNQDIIVSELNGSLRNANVEVSNLQEAILRMEREAKTGAVDQAKQKSITDELSKSVANLKSQIIAKDGEIEKMKDKLAGESERRVKIIAELEEEFEDRVVNSRVELEQVRGELATSIANLEQMSAKNSSLSLDAKKLRDERKKIEREMDKVRGELTSACSERDQLASSLSQKSIMGQWLDGNPLIFSLLIAIVAFICGALVM